MTITSSSAPAKRPHVQQSQQGLALVVEQQHHPLDDDIIRQQLADAVGSGDNERIFESARRLLAHKGANAAPIPQLLSVEQIAMKFNLCTRSIWRLIANGELPQPIEVGHARRWYASDIENYLRKLTEKRDGIQRRRRC